MYLKLESWLDQDDVYRIRNEYCLSFRGFHIGYNLKFVQGRYHVGHWGNLHFFFFFFFFLPSPHKKKKKKKKFTNVKSDDLSFKMIIFTHFVRFYSIQAPALKLVTLNCIFTRFALIFKIIFMAKCGPCPSKFPLLPPLPQNKQANMLVPPLSLV